MRFTLHAVDRRLYGRIKILHAKAQTIEAQRTKLVNLPSIDSARVNFDGELVIIAVIQIEGLMQRSHQFNQLLMGQISGRTPP